MFPGLAYLRVHVNEHGMLVKIEGAIADDDGLLRMDIDCITYSALDFRRDFVGSAGIPQAIIVDWYPLNDGICGSCGMGAPDDDDHMFCSTCGGIVQNAQDLRDSWKPFFPDLVAS